MTEPSNYGKRYWCIKVPESVSKDREIYLYADRVEFRDGALIFWGSFYPSKNDNYPDYEDPEGGEQLRLIFNKDQWLVCYTASLLDDSAVAVTKWKGEIV